jgi:outer membrane protein assembly factor BamA
VLFCFIKKLKLLKKITLIWLFCLLTDLLSAQKILTITFEPDSQRFDYQKNFPDSAQRADYLQKFLAKIQKKGYWQAHLQNVKYSADSLKVSIFLGTLFVWKKIDYSQVESIFLEKIKLATFPKTPVDWEIWETTAKKIVSNAENKGYPFAEVFLDSLLVESNEVSARLRMRKGFFVVWDTLSLQGNLKIKRSFLEKYLQLPPNEPLSQIALQKAETKLKNLGFARLTKPTQIVFEAQKAKPIFYANQSQSNEIDGILGFMPNELAPQTLLLTGQAQIRLRNLFASAKSLEIEFQQTRPRFQIINASYKHPILFGSPLGVELDFKLLREDTNFVNINRQIRFVYPLGLSKIKFLAGLQNSQTGFTISANTTQLPPNLENRYVFYGLGYEWNNLDDIFLPKNGYQLLVNIQTGNKTIVPLPFLPDTLYQNIQLRSLQTAISLQSNYYKMFSAKKGVFFRLETATLLNENLLLNELYRLGGLQNLRGFNQNFFFASSYLLTNLEYRFFWEQEAYFSVFYDQAFLQTKILQEKSSENPFGVGLGMNFRTKGGIFSLNYALGKSKMQDFSVARSKVHFGFVSRF